MQIISFANTPSEWQTPLQVVASIEKLFVWEVNNCPDFKGIKTSFVAKSAHAYEVNNCPDFKGIKTASKFDLMDAMEVNNCPDFKGIKTESSEHSLFVQASK